jgi:hypoxanthine-guanine phosphoribosyltransferase
VTQGKAYILVDDFVGMGGTFASLRGLIEAKGGQVIHAQALTGKPRSAKLALQPATLQALREKHGHIEPWWRTEVGYGFDALTESEALYLLRIGQADTIRRRLVEAKPQRDD